MRPVEQRLSTSVLSSTATENASQQLAFVFHWLAKFAASSQILSAIAFLIRLWETHVACQVPQLSACFFFFFFLHRHRRNPALMLMLFHEQSGGWLLLSLSTQLWVKSKRFFGHKDQRFLYRLKLSYFFIMMSLKVALRFILLLLMTHQAHRFLHSPLRITSTRSIFRGKLSVSIRFF